MSITIPSPIVKPYSNSGDNTAPPLAVSTTQANQETGFPERMSHPLPPNDDGLPILREQLNGILNFYTKQIQALVSGAQYTFDPYVSDENDGYPSGVVLYCASNNSYQRSLVDNNIANFVANPAYINDNIHWTSIESFFAATIERTLYIGRQGGATVANPIVYFSNIHNSFSTGLSVDTPTASAVYKLPNSAPTTDKMMWNSDTDGTTRWGWAKGNPVSAPLTGDLGEFIVARNPNISIPGTAGGTPVIVVELDKGTYLISLSTTAIAGIDTSVTIWLSLTPDESSPLVQVFQAVFSSMGGCLATASYPLYIPSNGTQVYFMARTGVGTSDLNASVMTIVRCG